MAVGRRNAVHLWTGLGLGSLLLLLLQLGHLAAPHPASPAPARRQSGLGAGSAAPVGAAPGAGAGAGTGAGAGAEAAAPDEYLVGVGIADITGPAADINLMGYAKPNQDSGGVHLRQFSRAIVIEDAHRSRVAYVSLDAGMVSQLLRSEVLKRLRERFGADLYTENNLMISASHTHSGPGGFFQYMLYNIPSAGFIGQTLDALATGAVRSVERATQSMERAHIYLAKGQLLNASVNRSPTSYLANPAEERARYEHDTDKTMTQLRFAEAATGRPMGALNWFAVHCTSMNNTNHLISGDNKGYASLLLEADYNPPGALPGGGPFVAIFAQANEGDVSPNTSGPRCIDTGLPCDFATSTCGTPPRNEKCIASGPGRDMFESTKIIAHKQYQKARQLFEEARFQRALRGPVRFVHEHIDMTNQQVPPYPAAEAATTGHNPDTMPAPDLGAATTTVTPWPLHEGAAGTTASHLSLAADSSDFIATGGTPSLPLGGEAEEEAATVTATANTRTTLPPAPRPVPNIVQSPAPLETCRAALGYSFAAGTTDGPGAFDFTQGDTVAGRYWNMVRDFLRRPSEKLKRCHKPKPILLATGEMEFPYMWHPRVVPTQILQIGQLVIVGLPGEFTTMSGRRVREAVSQIVNHNHGRGPATKAALVERRHATWRTTGSREAASSNATRTDLAHHIRQPEFEVVLAGLSNIYTSYITTFEEYQVQRYEGASTLFGPHTLQAYVNQFSKLAEHLVTGKSLAPNHLEPPDLTSSLFTLKTGVIFDSSEHGRNFGDSVVDVNSTQLYRCGSDIVRAVFVAGHPRNDLRLEGSFAYVDRYEPTAPATTTATLQTPPTTATTTATATATTATTSPSLESAQWKPVANDANWETKFIWERTSTWMGESRATIEWEPPHDCQMGVYRLRHLGAHKTLLQTVSQYRGLSSPFKVAPLGATEDQLAELDALLAEAEEASKTSSTDPNRQGGQTGDDHAHEHPSHKSGLLSLMYAPLQRIGSLFSWKRHAH